jgi:hypothetical protein
LHEVKQTSRRKDRKSISPATGNRQPATMPMP